MNIKRTRLADLNDLITVQLNPSDYKSKVDQALKNQSKKAKLPGFRPGMVPITYVRKVYGKNILVEEINHLLSHSLDNYLRENNIELLGEPIPYMEDFSSPNWDEEGDFEFKFEIGLTPDLPLNLLPEVPVKAYLIHPEPEMIEARMLNLRRAYGKITYPELSEKGDVLFLELKELDSTGLLLIGGIEKKSSLRTDLVQDKDILEGLVGLKKENEGKINLYKALGENAHALGHILDIDEKTAELVHSDFKFQVLNINRLNNADLDESFFLKLFPEGDIITENDFKLKIEEEINLRMKDLSDQRLESDLVLKMVHSFDSALPKEFLKKWLLSRKEERYSLENIDDAYLEFEKNLKWSLISNKIAIQEDLKVEPDEILMEAKQRLSNQFRMYSPEPIGEVELNEYAMKMLQNRDQVSQLYEEIRGKKVVEFVKTKIKVDFESIKYEDFLKV